MPSNADFWAAAGEPRALDGDEIKQAKTLLGMSDGELGDAVGLTAQDPAATVRKWTTDPGNNRHRPAPFYVTGMLKHLALGGPEWVIATEPEGGREYMIHLTAPRFMFRVASGKDEFTEEPVGLHIHLATGELLCEFVWWDMPPNNEEDRDALIKGGITAFEIYTQDSFDAEI
ncbi:MAG: hypothetical protein P1U84_12285 [Parvibaculaceae bacterium]|nr:hypothetical protein [Parvibaculaceae bacterium]